MSESLIEKIKQESKTTLEISDGFNKYPVDFHHDEKWLKVDDVFEGLGKVVDKIRQKIILIQGYVDLSESMLKKIRKKFAEKKLSDSTRQRLHDLTVDLNIWRLLQDTNKERLFEMKEVLGLLVEPSKEKTK